MRALSPHPSCDGKQARPRMITNNIPPWILLEGFGQFTAVNDLSLLCGPEIYDSRPNGAGKTTTSHDRHSTAPDTVRVDLLDRILPPSFKTDWLFAAERGLSKKANRRTRSFSASSKACRDISRAGDHWLAPLNTDWRTEVESSSKGCNRRSIHNGNTSRTRSIASRAPFSVWISQRSYLRNSFWTPGAVRR